MFTSQRLYLHPCGGHMFIYVDYPRPSPADTSPSRCPPKRERKSEREEKSCYYQIKISSLPKKYNICFALQGKKDAFFSLLFSACLVAQPCILGGLWAQGVKSGCCGCRGPCRGTKHAQRPRGAWVQRWLDYRQPLRVKEPPLTLREP